MSHHTFRNATGIATVLLMAAFDAGIAPSRAQERVPVPVGIWGGNGIQLTVTAAGATVDYGCDSGTVEEQLLTDGSGAFAASGTHSFGRGGPREKGDRAPKPHRARYEGTRNRDTMQLTVFLPELKRKVGEFTLALGQRASLERCG